MELSQFRRTANTPYFDIPLYGGSEYTAIGFLLDQIQQGEWGRYSNYKVVRNNGSTMIIQAHDTKARWVNKDNRGYQWINRVWAVVDVATNEVLSYYAIQIYGTYTADQVKTRTVL